MYIQLLSWLTKANCTPNPKLLPNLLILTSKKGNDPLSSSSDVNLMDECCSFSIFGDSFLLLMTTKMSSTKCIQILGSLLAFANVSQNWIFFSKMEFFLANFDDFARAAIFYRNTDSGFVFRTSRYINPENFIQIGRRQHSPIYHSIRFLHLYFNLVWAAVFILKCSYMIFSQLKVQQFFALSFKF
jgi:hypothetical protein